VKKYGTGSLAFDGTGDYLKMPTSPNFDFGTGDFTVECWVYLTGYSTSSNACVFDKDFNGATGTRSFSFVISGTGSSWTGIYMLLGNSAGSLAGVTGTTTLNLNTWYHLAYTRSSGTGYVFVNGNLLNSGSITTNIAINTTPVNVGRSGYSGYPYELPGYIDDLRITKGYARYTTNFTPLTAALPTY
jgi:Concanavalin A-like lectin/glucanases superfamily